MANAASNLLILILLIVGCIAVVLLKAFAGMSVVEAIIVGFPAAFCMLIATAFLVENFNNR